MSTDTFAPRAFESLVPSTASRRDHDAASARGYATGYAAGAHEAEREAAALREQLRAEHAEKLAALSEVAGQAKRALEAAATSARQQTVPVVEQAQDSIIAAALAVAEAVIGFELADRHDAARAALHRALAAPEGAHVRVRMNPGDIETLNGLGAVPDDVELVADPSISPGDAVSEFEHGFLDARIATAVERARAELTEADPLGVGDQQV